jgi:hypothetical protein
MRCYCCEQEIVLARKVKLRPVRDYDPSQGGPDSVAYQSYCEDMTFRWAFICKACYCKLDNEIGVAEIPGHGEFNLGGASRGDKAATVDEAKYQRFQRKEAERMGLEL